MGADSMNYEDVNIVILANVIEAFAAAAILLVVA